MTLGNINVGSGSGFRYEQFWSDCQIAFLSTILALIFMSHLIGKALATKNVCPLIFLFFFLLYSSPFVTYFPWLEPTKIVFIQTQINKTRTYTFPKTQLNHHILCKRGLVGNFTLYVTHNTLYTLHYTPSTINRTLDTRARERKTMVAR